MKRFIIIVSVCSCFLKPDLAHSQWVHTGGPFASVIRAFAADGTSLYAGDFFGLYQSSDAGSHWTFFPPSVQLHGVTGVGAYGNVILVGGYDSAYRSTDRGVSWSPSNGIGVSRIVTFAQIGGHFLAGAENGGVGMYLSSDSGATWSAATSGLPSSLQVMLLTVIGTKVHAMVSGVMNGSGEIALYGSTDQGVTWAQERKFKDQSRSVCLSQGNGSMLFVAEDSSVFRSSDAGATWTPVSQMGQGIVHSISTVGTSVFLGTSNGLFVSTDAGSSWNPTGPSLLSHHSPSLIVSDGSSLFAALDSSGILRSTDNGQSWRGANVGLKCSSRVRSFATNSGGLYAGTLVWGIFRSDDDGATWTMANRDVPCYQEIVLASHGSDLFAGAYNGLYRLTDGGLNSMSSSNGLLANYPVSSIATSDAVFLAALPNGMGVYRSTDNGVTWNKPTQNGLDGKIVNTLAIGVGGCYAGAETGLFVSSDDGLSWSTNSTTSPNPSKVVSIATIGADVYAGSGLGSILHTTNQGASWETMSEGLSGGPILCLYYVDSRLFAGTTNGAYGWDAAGKKWRHVSEGITDSTAVVALRQSGLYLLAATDSGVWRRPLSELEQAGVPQPPTMGTSLTSEPNPLSASCTIRFTTNESGEVQASIVNLLGSRVAELCSGHLAAGDHSLSWDARSIASGTYICIVRTANTVQSLPIIVSH